jgi:hypothetical protein
VPKRLTAILVTLPLVAALLILPAAQAQPGVGPCDFTRRTGETIHHLMKRRITCAAERFGPIPGGAKRAICIAKRESGLDPSATSATGMYLGLYQQAKKYWPDRYDAYTQTAWQLSGNAKNGRSNSVVTIRMVRRAGSWKAAGWPAKGC